MALDNHAGTDENFQPLEVSVIEFYLKSRDKAGLRADGQGVLETKELQQLLRPEDIALGLAVVEGLKEHVVNETFLSVLHLVDQQLIRGKSIKIFEDSFHMELISKGLEIFERGNVAAEFNSAQRLGPRIVTALTPIVYTISPAPQTPAEIAEKFDLELP